MQKFERICSQRVSVWLRSSGGGQNGRLSASLCCWAHGCIASTQNHYMHVTRRPNEPRGQERQHAQQPMLQQQ
jgi:hypothetical protein